MIPIVRIPLLVVVLLAGGPLLRMYSQQRMRLNPEGMIASLGPWLLLVALAVVFLAVTFAGRDQRHPAWVLAIEYVVAGLFAVVPPMLWYLVFGLGIVADAMGSTTGSAYAQVLAVAWLVVAVRTGRRQRKRAKALGEAEA